MEMSMRLGSREEYWDAPKAGVVCFGESRVTRWATPTWMADLKWVVAPGNVKGKAARIGCPYLPGPTPSLVVSGHALGGSWYFMFVLLLKSLFGHRWLQRPFSWFSNPPGTHPQLPPTSTSVLESIVLSTPGRPTVDQPPRRSDRAAFDAVGLQSGPDGGAESAKEMGSTGPGGGPT